MSLFWTRWLAVVTGFRSLLWCRFVKELHIPEELRRMTAEQEVHLSLTTHQDAQRLKLQDGQHREFNEKSVAIAMNPANVALLC